jgi:hypothetical protein
MAFSIGAVGLVAVSEVRFTVIVGNQLAVKNVRSPLIFKQRQAPGSASSRRAFIPGGISTRKKYRRSLVARPKIPRWPFGGKVHSGACFNPFKRIKG